MPPVRCFVLKLPKGKISPASIETRTMKITLGAALIKSIRCWEATATSSKIDTNIYVDIEVFVRCSDDV